MEWDDKYLIGVKDIDEQHKKIVKVICAYKKSFSDKTVDSGIEMGKIIVFLVKYANYHFQAEEAFMERIDYPDLEHHRQIHFELTEELKEVLMKLKTKQSYTPIEFYYFLMKWLTDHIEEEDNKIGQYYKDYRKNLKQNVVLDDPEYILSVFEPNIQKLRLLRENNLINEKDATKKKINFVKLFYKKHRINNIDAIKKAMFSVSILLSNNILDAAECKEVKIDIISNIKINNLLVDEENLEKSLKIIKELYEDDLLSKEIYNLIKKNIADSI